MVIKTLKPSQRVQGRWLAQLEDGSLLRLGENEVLNFSLYAGRELTDESALPQFSALGYHFDEKLSRPSELVFVRRAQ